MSKRISQETKNHIVELRRRDRLSSIQIRDQLRPADVSITTICHLLKPYPLLPRERRRRGIASATTKGIIWTQTERQILARLWGQHSRGKLTEALPDRTWGAISRQAAIMRLKRSRSASKRESPYHIDPLFKRLREIREDRNISRQQLADRIGIHKQMLARYELGEHRPSWNLFRCWVEALGCEITIK